MAKFIVVTGGVVSGLGKGIVAASLGRLLKCRGLKVTCVKLDPYMNVDPGTMNPVEHGEVFVTEDGLETDLDLGHYERFIDENLNRFSNLTSGRVYFNVLAKERRGDYDGKTVQIIPHVTDEIKAFIRKTATTTKADVVIVEIGGTIGDIESMPFLEAVRQLSFEEGRESFCFVHVCLVPFISGSNEYKSKPTQHSVKELQSYGVYPDVIVTRTDDELPVSLQQKIAMFCNVAPDCVINNITLDELYDCPLYLHGLGLDTVVCRKLKLTDRQPDLTDWKAMTQKIRQRKGNVTVGIVGKYVKLHDAYISIVESLKHASYQNGVNVDIKWLDSEQINADTAESLLGDCDGILVPGGFGTRGIEGKIYACRYAREHDVPYFGICLGMQLFVIEFARDVCGIKDATSRELNADGKNCVIDLMENQKGVQRGGTMRLGAYPCQIVKNTAMERAYKQEQIMERHRHRYEFNNAYADVLTNSGLVVSGTSPDKTIVETVELKDRDFFVGVQFHPEFKSRPDRPHPLFCGFVAAAQKRKNFKEEK